MPTDTTIFKILPRQEWSKAVEAGSYEGSAVDVADGFIHFSTQNQVQDTARKHFAGQTDLVLVAIAVDRLPSALRWEPSRGGQLFPHLYAPLPTSAALWVKPLIPDPWSLIPDP